MANKQQQGSGTSNCRAQQPLALGGPPLTRPQRHGAQVCFCRGRATPPARSRFASVAGRTAPVPARPQRQGATAAVRRPRGSRPRPRDKRWLQPRPRTAGAACGAGDVTRPVPGLTQHQPGHVGRQQHGPRGAGARRQRRPPGAQPTGPATSDCQGAESETRSRRPPRPIPSAGSEQASASGFAPGEDGRGGACVFASLRRLPCGTSRSRRQRGDWGRRVR